MVFGELGVERALRRTRLVQLAVQFGLVVGWLMLKKDGECTRSPSSNLVDFGVLRQSRSSQDGLSEFVQ